MFIFYLYTCIIINVYVITTEYDEVLICIFIKYKIRNIKE